MKDGIIVIERFERGGLVAYSIDEGETFHETVREAFEHKAEQLRKLRESSGEHQTLRELAQGGGTDK